MTIERYRMIRRFLSKGFPGVVLFLPFINLTFMGYASEAPIGTALEFRKVVETRTSESNDVIESINIPDPTSSTFRSRSHMGSPRSHMGSDHIWGQSHMGSGLYS